MTRLEINNCTLEADDSSCFSKAIKLEFSLPLRQPRSLAVGLPVFLRVLILLS
jgi:hypothetical protein